jgi:hypothetical protein
MKPSIDTTRLACLHSAPIHTRSTTMTRRRAVLAGLGLVLVAACAAHWDVDQFAAPEANFAAKRTFFWKGGELGTPSALPAGVLQQADQQVRAAVIEELTRKGYSRTESAEGADMIVSYQVSGTRKFVVADDRRVGAPSPNTVLSPSEMQPPPASELPREVAVRDGSVIVFVDDPAANKLVWRGAITAETRAGSREEGVRQIAEMAREIARQVPGRTAP